MAMQPGELACAFLLSPRKISVCLKAGWQRSWPNWKMRRCRSATRELRCLTKKLRPWIFKRHHPAIDPAEESGRTEHDSRQLARNVDSAAGITITIRRPGGRYSFCFAPAEPEENPDAEKERVFPY